MSTYTVKKIESADHEEVIRFLKRTFFVSEPMNASVALSEDPLACEDMEAYCRSPLKANYSLKAVDHQGNIISVILNDITPLEKEAEKHLLQAAESCKSSLFKKILQFLAVREQKGNLAERFPGVDRFMEVKVVATDPSWQRRGIMKALLKETEDMTRDAKVGMLRMDTSSHYSWLAAASAGFQCVSILNYSNYKVDGQVFFKTASPHLEDRVNVKLLN